MINVGMGMNGANMSDMRQQAPIPWSQTQYGQESAQKSAEGIAHGHDLASELPAQLKQGRFNTVYPQLAGALGGFGAWGSGGGFGAGNTSPGQVGTAPQINAAPVWTQDQIQQQINGQTAQNDAKTGGQLRQIDQSTAGRGFGASSPLAQALGTIAQGQNTATNTQNAQQTQWNAAQGNAQQLLAGQQAQESQFANRQNEDIERHKVIAGRQNALLAALTGLAS